MRVQTADPFGTVMTKHNSAKVLYKELRGLPWWQLWSQEAARFDAATPEERNKRVAVIRAVGVVFAESGPVEEKEKVRDWLLGLLQDPDEKIRRGSERRGGTAFRVARDDRGAREKIPGANSGQNRRTGRVGTKFPRERGAENQGQHRPPGKPKCGSIPWRSGPFPGVTDSFARTPGIGANRQR